VACESAHAGGLRKGTWTSAPSDRSFGGATARCERALAALSEMGDLRRPSFPSIHHDRPGCFEKHMSRVHVATGYAARSQNVVLRRRERRKMRAERARSELSPLLNLESDSLTACKESWKGDWFYCRRTGMSCFKTSKV